MAISSNPKDPIIHLTPGDVDLTVEDGVKFLQHKTQNDSLVNIVKKEESPWKNNGAKPGEDRGAGRKPSAEKAFTIEQRREVDAKIANAARNIALPAILELANQSKDSGIRFKASQELMNRAFGKPKEFVEHSGEIGSTTMVELSDKNVAQIVGEFEAKLKKQIQE
jgi:hypothetical protein